MIWRWSDDNQLDMYIDNIKKTKHNDQTNHVKIAIDIDCIDDDMGEMNSVYANIIMFRFFNIINIHV